MNRTPKTVTALLLLAVATAGLSACAEDPAICQDVDELRSDFDDLKDIQIEAGALSELATDVDEIEADVKQLVDDASTEFGTEVDAVKAATEALRAGIDGATTDPSADALVQVSDGVAALTTAVGDLSDAVSGTC